MDDNKNLEVWDKLRTPPPSALKTIKGGRLSGMTDISPQFRYQAMTEVFGICGVGWRYEIVRLWVEPANDLICAFAEIKLYIKDNDKWSESIPGIGGSMLISKEKAGPYVSDEAYKMAVTDALSVAMKMIGMAADIYAGLWDGSKYRDATKNQPNTDPVTIPKTSHKTVSDKQWTFIKKLGSDASMNDSELKDMIKWLAAKLNVPNNHWKIAKTLLGDDPELNFQAAFTEYCEYQSSRNKKDGEDIPY